VRAVATDDTRVVRMEIWVDLKRKKSVRGSAVSWRWALRHARRGRHLIAVRAFDAAGHEATATVRPFVVR
jgi:NAD(P)H-dependent flavin oxidoreductase YrpB (nitropropane dioxygenase family)